MTKINEFDEREFESGTGLPDGDTFIDLKEADFEPVTQRFDGKEVQKYIYREGELEYFLPKSLMKQIRELSDKGAKKVRVTRSGKDKETRYTAVKVIE